MSEENKAISRRIFEEVLNQGNVDLFDELHATNLIDHAAPPGTPPGTEFGKQTVAMFRAAFPDFSITVDDMIAEGDKVVNRWTFRGTHEGELMGIAPTGKQVEMTGIFIDRIVGGKVVEHWANFDQLGLLQQLGVIPPMGESEA